jgi:hypothetical protein
MATNAEVSRSVAPESGGCPHPNDVDRKRIERALAGRERYRYVTPAVRPTERGYRIESPCCSRNIDEHGGIIDIARIVFVAGPRGWQLYRRNHEQRAWEYYAAYATLAALLTELNQDRRRVFWQ